MGRTTRVKLDRMSLEELNALQTVRQAKLDELREEYAKLSRRISVQHEAVEKVKREKLRFDSSLATLIKEPNAYYQATIDYLTTRFGAEYNGISIEGYFGATTGERSFEINLDRHYAKDIDVQKVKDFVKEYVTVAQQTWDPRRDPAKQYWYFGVRTADLNASGISQLRIYSDGTCDYGRSSGSRFGVIRSFENTDDAIDWLDEYVAELRKEYDESRNLEEY